LHHLNHFKYRESTNSKTRLTRHDEHSHAADMFRYFAVSADIWKDTYANIIRVKMSKAYNPLWKYG
jgi:hypothetical protein